MTTGGIMAKADDEGMVTRPAEGFEVERMSCPVLWMYERGQAVVLWTASGRISLLPDTVPPQQVVLLQKCPDILRLRPAAD